MSGSIQSSDYVPGVSGWKLYAVSGELEINSCTLGSVGKAPDRQMVSVEVASYSKYDLPKNAANLVQFMEAELQKVPEEYRHAAEFEEFDASYGDDSFSPRLFLSYSRLETAEELADRLEKAKSAGTQIKIEGGVTTITHDGVIRFRIGNLAAAEPEHGTADQPAKPFVVVDGTTYLNEAFIKDGTVDGKIATNWQVKLELYNGRYVAAGIGLGFDRFALEIERRSADAVRSAYSQIRATINDTALGKELSEEIGKIHPRGKFGELEDHVATLEQRLTRLESNRFRRPQ